LLNREGVRGRVKPISKKGTKENQKRQTVKNKKGKQNIALRGKLKTTAKRKDKSNLSSSLRNSASRRKSCAFRGENWKLKPGTSFGLGAEGARGYDLVKKKK